MYAARLLKIKYAPKPAVLGFDKHLAEARSPGRGGRGGATPAPSSKAIDDAMSKAEVVVDHTYTTPIQNHNPMEPQATIAWWEGEKLHVYDSTQGIFGVKQTLSRTLSIPADNITVDCPFTGGGFGCKGSVWSNTPLAALAARLVQQPVQLVLGRYQMFGPIGSRPGTSQRVKLGATRDGKLMGIQHDAICTNSVQEDFVESSTNVTHMLYASEVIETTQKLVDMNIGVGTFQRAPGEATGTVALEVAMDELAEKLKMDPVDLRMVNYTEIDPGKKVPFTSKHLKACYEQASERFGWKKRNATPGQTREGNKLIGVGMATATYPANRQGSAAIVRMSPDGTAYVGCGTQDLGTGTYTILATTAATALGIDWKLVKVKLGDTTLPRSGGSGGSTTAASVCPAVLDACMQLKLKLAELATNDSRSPLHGTDTKDIDLKGGKIVMKSMPSKGEEIAVLLQRNGNAPVEAKGSAEPHRDPNVSSHSFGAVFAEVAVDQDTHMVHVRRVVATYDIGVLMNQKTGLNQLMGGIVWGVSTALHEASEIDTTYGRTVNENLAEYHVPVNADIGELDVTVVGIPDPMISPIGARGIGEIGITGVAAAISNAIYNATGKRVRDFPMTVDKIMQA
jgi:xanthine dehydrogenase YagR molybdenum-binding subunit